MKSKKILFKVLQWGLMDIQDAAKEAENSRVLVMANFLRKLPFELLRAKTQEEHDKILEDLESTCKNNVGMQNFLNQVKESRIESA